MSVNATADELAEFAAGSIDAEYPLATAVAIESALAEFIKQLLMRYEVVRKDGPGPLQEELAYYRSIKDRLITAYDAEGEFVVIAGRDIMGFRGEFADALNLGYRECGLGPFLVKKVERVETVAHV